MEGVSGKWREHRANDTKPFIKKRPFAHNLAQKNAKKIAHKNCVEKIISSID